MLIDEWVKKMEYYSALQKETHICAPREHYAIMLSEISQPQKNKFCMISHVESERVKFIETEQNVCQGLGKWGKGEKLVKGYKLRL